MKLSILAVRSLQYYLQEVMEANGFNNGEYTVDDSDPTTMTDRDDVIFPIVTVGNPHLGKVPIQITSKEAKKLSLAIDIYANSKGQQSDLKDVLDENLSGKYLNVYNFNQGFPASVGDYSGLTVLGKMIVEHLDSTDLAVAKFSRIEQEKYHELMLITVILPLVSI